MSSEKQCTKCRIEKPLSEFSRHKKHRDGLDTRCKECRVLYRQRPEARARQAINRMRHKGLPIDLTTHEIAWSLGGCNCTYCGTELDYSKTTLDTVIPTDRKGPNTFANTTVACRSCNSRKGNQPALLFMLTEVEPYYNRKLLEQMALRSRQSVSDMFEELVIDAQAYFADKAQSARAVMT